MPHDSVTTETVQRSAPPGTRFDEDGRPRFPLERPVLPGETPKEARRRRDLNRAERRAYWAWWSAICGRCGEVRGHVNHEPNPATSIEGPDYYADFLDELHEFVEAS